jgi:hypothetical protein
MARTVGLILILLGVVGLAFGGITYARQHKSVDLGPVEVTTTEKKTVPIPPIAGAVAVAAGLVLILTDRRRVEA